MSCKGNCRDNTPTEEIFHSLKYEPLNYETFKTQDAAKLSLIEYLAFSTTADHTQVLSYQSPLEFERDFCTHAAR